MGRCLRYGIHIDALRKHRLDCHPVCTLKPEHIIQGPWTCDCEAIPLEAVQLRNCARQRLLLWSTQRHASFCSGNPQGRCLRRKSLAAQARREVETDDRVVDGPACLNGLQEYAFASEDASDAFVDGLSKAVEIVDNWEPEKVLPSGFAYQHMKGEVLKGLNAGRCRSLTRRMEGFSSSWRRMRWCRVGETSLALNPLTLWRNAWKTGATTQ